MATYLTNEDSPEATAATEYDGSCELTFSISEELVLEAEIDRFETYMLTVDFVRSTTYDVALEELDGYVASGVVTDHHGAGTGDVEIGLQRTGTTTETDASDQHGGNIMDWPRDLRVREVPSMVANQPTLTKMEGIQNV